jgi:hypothetical protein
MASCEARENHGFVVSRRFGMSMGRLTPDVIIREQDVQDVDTGANLLSSL